MLPEPSLITISEVADINPSVSVGSLSHTSPVSFIPMADVSETGIWTGSQVRQLREVRSGYTPFSEGDLLFAKITPCMENGKGCHAFGLVNGIGFGTTEFHVLRVKPGHDARFLFHWLNSKALRHRAEAMMTGSAGQRRVPTEFFHSFLIPHRTLDEQRRIAEILDTADAMIQKNEAVIGKLRLMKAGLMHDLLTRGLDDSGELREFGDLEGYQNRLAVLTGSDGFVKQEGLTDSGYQTAFDMPLLRDPVRHPEQFKDSKIGRIPRAWDVSRLQDISVDGIKNGFFKRPDAVGRGCRLVNVVDLYQDFGVDLNRVERVVASKQEQEQFAVRPGDCFFTRSSLVLSGIAHCNVVRQVEEPAVFECHIIRVRPNQRQIMPEFLTYWCRSPASRSFLMARAKHTTMTTISQPDIALLPVPMPSLSEQLSIVKVLDEYSECIQAEVSLRNKLILQKQGLMADLLTGRISAHA